jgi:hypothetical protein
MPQSFLDEIRTWAISAQVDGLQSIFIDFAEAGSERAAYHYARRIITGLPAIKTIERKRIVKRALETGERADDAVGFDNLDATIVKHADCYEVQIRRTDAERFRKLYRDGLDDMRRDLRGLTLAKLEAAPAPQRSYDPLDSIPDGADVDPFAKPEGEG